MRMSDEPIDKQCLRLLRAVEEKADDNASREEGELTTTTTEIAIITDEGEEGSTPAPNPISFFAKAMNTLKSQGAIAGGSNAETNVNMVMIPNADNKVDWPSQGFHSMPLSPGRNDVEIEMIEPDTDVLMVTVSTIHEASKIQDEIGTKPEDCPFSDISSANITYDTCPTESDATSTCTEENKNVAVDVGCLNEDHEKEMLTKHSDDTRTENDQLSVSLDKSLDSVEIVAHCEVVKRKGEKSSPKKNGQSPKKVDNELVDHVMDKILKGTCFFSMKTNVQENMYTAKSENVWSTRAGNLDKIRKALPTAKNVILFLSLNRRGKYSGFARVVRIVRNGHNGKRIHWVGKLGVDQGRMLYPTEIIELDWISKHELMYCRAHFLRNSWNENHNIKFDRDGQEIDPQTGGMLVSLFRIDLSIDWKKVDARLGRPNPNRATKSGNKESSEVLKVTSAPTRKRPLVKESAVDKINYHEFSRQLTKPARSTSTPLQRAPEESKKTKDTARCAHRSQHIRIRTDLQPHSWKDVCKWCSKHLWRAEPPVPPMPFPPPAPFDFFPPPKRAIPSLLPGPGPCLPMLPPPLLPGPFLPIQPRPSYDFFHDPGFPIHPFGYRFGMPF